MITEKAIKMASSPIESILQLIEKGLHAQARYTYLEYFHTPSAQIANNCQEGRQPLQLYIINYGYGILLSIVHFQ